MKTSTSLGKLYLIPTTMGDCDPKDVLPQTIKRCIDLIDYYVVENDKVVGTETVFLSSNKGNIDKLEALQREHGNQLCVIDGKSFGYESDLVLLTNTYNPDYS